MIADFIIHNHGSVVLVVPVTRTAREWVDFNVLDDEETPLQWFGGGFAVEPRCLPNLLDNIRADGFTVGDAA